MLSLASNLSDDAIDEELKESLGSAKTQPETKPTETKKDAGKEKEQADKETKDKDTKKDEEAEEVSEEEAAAGLGALFD